MNKKKRNIILAIVLVLFVIIALWIGGVIPKGIARTLGIANLRNKFPAMDLKFVSIEWAHSFGAYEMKVIDNNQEVHSVLIGPKYFPVNPGQGTFPLEEKYQEKYGELSYENE